ncbi:signal peptidase I [Streptomyces sp. RB6PN25]|uniref:Signal peptidase I n=1 Tax=Streptomyces humicola TaxID=2953240 RepID=A0ABT1Q2L4_9ACTN|nr:signal peptidase I [Streptomyces humicola]MCQ4084178.1 signal peptidase I [Streptomyces humicola]
MGNRGRSRYGQRRAQEPPDRPGGSGGGTGPGEAQQSARTGPRTGQGRAERRRAAQRIKRRRRRSAIKEVPILVGIALLIALVLKTFLVQAFVIPSGSMENTIQVGDRVLVDKLTPWFGSKPSRGDVVVFQDPDHWLEGEPQPKPDPEGIRQIKDFFTFIGLLPASNEQDLIKRVIGVPGDTVACCDPQGRLTVNGQALNEPYVMPGNPPSMIRFSVKVPAGRLWVMGDHRSNSADSRYHMNDPGGGTVPESDVVGRAVVIAWPVSHWATLPEPSTFASVPDARAAGTSTAGNANNRQRLIQLPTPAELSLVMGVVGLRRVRGGPWRGVRSGCGGRGSRRTIRTRRARRAGRPGERGRGRGGGGESGQVP